MYINRINIHFVYLLYITNAFFHLHSLSRKFVYQIIIPILNTNKCEMCFIFIRSNDTIRYRARYRENYCFSHVFMINIILQHVLYHLLLMNKIHFTFIHVVYIIIY